MATLHKQNCPTCGQSVNQRQIALYKGLVEALWRIFLWCDEKKRNEFNRKDVKHLFSGENDTARFGDWVFFGGLVYKKGKGHYGLNMERCAQFFAGTYKIPVSVWKDPLTQETHLEDYRLIKEIPILSGFLDNNKEYIAKYRTTLF